MRSNIAQQIHRDASYLARQKICLNTKLPTKDGNKQTSVHAQDADDMEAWSGRCSLLDSLNKITFN